MNATQTPLRRLQAARSALALLELWGVSFEEALAVKALDEAVAAFDPEDAGTEDLGEHLQDLSEEPDATLDQLQALQEGLGAALQEFAPIVLANPKAD